jgi:hypothetical protein
VRQQTRPMVIWPRRRIAAYPASHLASLKRPIPKPDELLVRDWKQKYCGMEFGVYVLAEPAQPLQFEFD